MARLIWWLTAGARLGSASWYDTRPPASTQPNTLAYFSHFSTSSLTSPRLFSTWPDLALSLSGLLHFSPLRAYLYLFSSTAWRSVGCAVGGREGRGGKNRENNTPRFNVQKHPEPNEDARKGFADIPKSQKPTVLYLVSTNPRCPLKNHQEYHRKLVIVHGGTLSDPSTWEPDFQLAASHPNLTNKASSHLNGFICLRKTWCLFM